MRFLQMKVNAGKQEKAPPWLPIVLLLVLISLIALIVYQVRKTPGRGKPATPEYSSALEKIDESIANLKEKIEDRSPLEIAETLAQRPEPPPVPTQAVEIVVSNAPAESLLQKVADLKEAMQAKVTGQEKSANALPTLKGVFWNQTNPLALMNDMLVGVDEKVGSYTIVAIAEDQVTVKDVDGGSHEVPLYKD